MKHIGFTTEGNDLVEMSKEEFGQLVRLKISVEGGSGLPFLEPHDHARFDFNFTKTFEVIQAWFLSRMKVNEFQQLLDAIKGSLEDA